MCAARIEQLISREGMFYKIGIGCYLPQSLTGQLDQSAQIAARTRQLRHQCDYESFTKEGLRGDLV